MKPQAEAGSGLPHRTEYCSDLLSAAIEGGISYWAKGRKFEIGQAGTDGEPTYLSCEIRPHNDEGPAFENGDKRNNWQRLDLAKMAAAIELLLSDAGATLAGSHIIEDLRADWHDRDSLRFDAETADVVVQVALFGEIIFG